MSLIAAGVFGRTLTAGFSSLARESCQRSRISPASKSRSAQVSPNPSDNRSPV